jgi:peptidoglycan/xylan/chitin deacetylase (PgdA/CDA1 family)
MGAIGVIKGLVPAPAYRLVRQAGLAALGSVTGVDVGGAGTVALTFDDGPGPATPEVLEVLGGFRARATFFLLGQNVVRYADFARAIVPAGHEVANHTFSHRPLPELSSAERRAEIARGHQAILDVTGVAPRLIRPPFGFQTVPAYLDARRSYREVVGWSLVGEDWAGDSADVIAARVTGAIQPGDIVLLHDAAPDPEGPTADRWQTVLALEKVLGHLAERDLRSVTVSELLASGPARRKLWFRRGREGAAGEPIPA